MSNTPKTDALREQNLNARNDFMALSLLDSVLSSHEDIEEQLAAAEKDAERYRFMRSANTWLTGAVCDKRFMLREERLDEAIDAYKGER